MKPFAALKSVLSSEGLLLLRITLEDFFEAYTRTTFSWRHIIVLMGQWD